MGSNSTAGVSGAVPFDDELEDGEDLGAELLDGEDILGDGSDYGLAPYQDPSVND